MVERLEKSRRLGTPAPSENLNPAILHLKIYVEFVQGVNNTHHGSPHDFGRKMSDRWPVSKDHWERPRLQLGHLDWRMVGLALEPLEVGLALEVGVIVMVGHLEWVVVHPRRLE